MSRNITLAGRVTGRSHPGPELLPNGTPKPSSHDLNVMLTIEIHMQGARPSILEIPFKKLERGYLEIGAEVVINLSEWRPATENAPPTYNVEVKPV